MVLFFERNDINWEYYGPKIKLCQNLCRIIFVFSGVLLIFIFIGTFLIKYNHQVNILYIETERPTFYTNPKFLSIALDSSVIADGFKKFRMKNYKLIKLVKALSPAYLRVGGNLANRLLFTTDDFRLKTTFSDRDIDGGDCSYGEEWLELNHFASNTNVDLIFDLNALIRFANGSWNSTNAEKLIEFSSQHKLKLNWELGNEPNAYFHQFDYEVNASQLATDFYKLKTILSKYSLYKNSLLLGPDTTRPRLKHKQSTEYLEEFLFNTGQLVDAITWHHYYFNGRTANPSDFINPMIFDILKWQITIIKSVIRQANLYDVKIWLGETSSAWGGGACGFSNRFIGSFIWVDKLGISAKMGLDVVIRQSIFKGYYALIDDDYNPTPDWWISIIYKKLVGPQVISCYSASTSNVRLYCHCTKRDKVFKKPAITVFGMNLDNIRAKVRLEGILSHTENNEKILVQAYTLTSNFVLTSKNILLNGMLLKLTNNYDVPYLEPNIISADPYIEMPAYSIVFWVIPTDVPYCVD